MKSRSDFSNKMFAMIFSLTIIFSSLSAGFTLVTAGEDTEVSDMTDDISQPIVIELAPSGGELWKGGEVIDIEWVIPNDVELSKNPISIYYSIDDGQTWAMIAEREDNDGTFSWKLPHITSELCLIKNTVFHELGVSHHRLALIVQVFGNVTCVRRDLLNAGLDGG